MSVTHGQGIRNGDYGMGKQAPNTLMPIADDWGYSNTGAYGDNVVQTPNFDRIAREGVLFANAFTTPSCSPSRASLLTGQWPHQLEEAVHLKGFLNKKFPNYVELLAEQGYATELCKKGWDPGNINLADTSIIRPGQHIQISKRFLETAGQASRLLYSDLTPLETCEEGYGGYQVPLQALITISMLW